MKGHPEVADRDCSDCLLFMYNHETGEKRYEKDGTPTPRPAYGGGAPCSRGPKACAKVSPTSGIALNDRNRRAYEFDQECKSVNHWPDDPIVLQNARVIRQIEDGYEKLWQLKLRGAGH